MTAGSFLARELGLTFDSVTIGKRAALMSGVRKVTRHPQIRGTLRLGAPSD